MIRNLLCKLGFHKYYCKTYVTDEGFIYNNGFECKYCKKIITWWQLIRNKK